MNIFEIEELRARGLSDEALFPDSSLVKAEERTWALIELFCNQFFEPRVFSDADGAYSPPMLLDGSGKSHIRLPVPLVSLSALVIDTTSVDVDDVVVYNRLYPDDRRNPKLLLKSGAAVSAFRSGEHNISISGTFGYVDKDNLPPSPLREVALQIMMLELRPLLGSGGFMTPKRGKLVSEMSDDYMYKLESGLPINGVTGIPEIDKVLFMYRRGGFLNGRVV